MHTRVLCGWKDGCEVSAVHEKVTVYTTSNRDGVAARATRRCRGRDPMTEGGSPPPIVVSCDEDTGDVGAEGRSGVYGQDLQTKQNQNQAKR